MIDFLCIFFPPVLALGLFELITKKPLTLKRGLFRYCTYGVLINFFSFWITLYAFTVETSYFLGYMNAALIYLGISFGVSLILVFGEILLSKKIKISVEDNTDENS